MRFTIQRRDDGRGPYRKIPIVRRGPHLARATIYETRGDDLTADEEAKLRRIMANAPWYVLEASE